MRTIALALLLALVVGPAAAAQTKAAPGGAGPRPSTEGCMREWLFNGVWRVRVTRVDALRTAQPGWGVMTEFRNGTKRTASLHGTGVTSKFQLAMADGSIVPVLWSPGGIGDDAYYRSLPPGGSLIHQLRFVRGVTAEMRPSKLLIEVQRTGLGRGWYQISNPSFRVRLDCST